MSNASCTNGSFMTSVCVSYTLMTSVCVSYTLMTSVCVSYTLKTSVCVSYTLMTSVCVSYTLMTSVCVSYTSDDDRHYRQTNSIKRRIKVVDLKVRVHKGRYLTLLSKQYQPNSLKWQCIFSFLCRCFLSSITAKTFTGLDCIYMRNTVGVLSEAGTAYSSRAPEFTPGYLVGPCCSSF